MTHRTHDRSPSPGPDADAEPALLKRLKSSHISDAPAPAPAAAGSAGADPTPHFAPDLFAPANIHRLHTEYDASAPFKHTLVEKLFQDDLLQKVKDEALAELSFSEKETDIYKVRARVLEARAGGRWAKAGERGKPPRPRGRTFSATFLAHLAAGARRRNRS